MSAFCLSAKALKSFMTPIQLFARGVLVHNVDLADPVDDETFSIGNLESPAVTVPVINNPLTAQQLLELNLLISTRPGSTSDFSIDMYHIVKRYVCDNVSQ